MKKEMIKKIKEAFDKERDTRSFEDELIREEIDLLEDYLNSKRIINLEELDALRYEGLFKKIEAGEYAKKTKEEIEDFLSYAIKEGYIDDVDGWTEKQKKDYYNKCMAFEPDKD